MSGAVFVYGSLTAPEVVHVLLHRAPQRRRADLHGYRRHAIQGQVYPAIIPTSDKDIVEGWVLMGLSDKEMHILDEYEDVDYYRTTKSPVFEDNTSMEAEVYVWRPEKMHLLHGIWDYEEFRRTHLAAYLQMSQEFLNEYNQLVGEGKSLNGWRE